MDNIHRYKVDIFGSLYQLKSEKQEDQIFNLVAVVNDTMQKIAQKSDHYSTEQVAILAALQLAEELEEEKSAHNTQCNQILDRIKRAL